MSVYTELIHLVNVRRPTHAIAGQTKSTADALVATDVECRIESTGATPERSILGGSVLETWRILFEDATDVQVRDVLVWGDRSIELEVDSIRRAPSHDLYDHDALVEAAAHTVPTN